MKRSKAHVVPLSEAALGLLAKADAFRVEGAEVVFSGATGKAMSDMTLLKVLRDMQEPFHVHGFRSAFTDWERTRASQTRWLRLRLHTRHQTRFRRRIAAPPTSAPKRIPVCA